MTSTSNDTSCPKLDRPLFDFAERTLMQFGLYAFLVIGFFGIHQHRPGLGMGIPDLRRRHRILRPGVLSTICARCPYPYKLEHLPVPARTGWSRRSNARRRTPIRTWQKVGVTVFFLSLLVLPLPWLAGQPPLLAGFLGLALPVFGTVVLYYCKRCRNRRCPFNRVQGAAG